MLGSCGLDRGRSSGAAATSVAAAATAAIPPPLPEHCLRAAAAAEARLLQMSRSQFAAGARPHPLPPGASSVATSTTRQHSPAGVLHGHMFAGAMRSTAAVWLRPRRWRPPAARPRGLLSPTVVCVASDHDYIPQRASCEATSTGRPAVVPWPRGRLCCSPTSPLPCAR